MTFSLADVSALEGPFPPPSALIIDCPIVPDPFIVRFELPVRLFISPSATPDTPPVAAVLIGRRTVV